MLAKGNVCIRMEELKELIGLDENAEIVSVNLDGHGVELKIISSEPIEGITQIQNGEIMRRKHIKLPVSINEEVAREFAREVVNDLRKKGINNDA